MPRPWRCAALPVAAEPSSTFSTYIIGLAVMSCRRANTGRSSAVIAASRAALPSRSASSAFLTTGASAAASLSPPLARFSRLGRRFSRLSRSASISSVSTISASRTGSTLPETWVTSPSSKQRSTWAIASTSRMLPRNWLPSPSPLRGALHQAGDVDELELGRDDLGRARRSPRACRAADRARRRGRRSARWCRTDSSPPAPPGWRSAR